MGLMPDYYPSGVRLRLFLSFICVFCASQLLAQPQPFSFITNSNSSSQESALSATPPPDAEFSFVRLMYDQGMTSFGRRAPWRTDWPEAETHFLQGISRLSILESAGQARSIRLTDEAIFDYPWLYSVDVGKWSLTDEEAANLREYLLRGGFMMVDDFHGSYEWQVFLTHLQKAFPDRPIVEIPEDDALMSVMFELDKSIQIPGIRAYNSGQTWEQDGYTPHWRGIYDDHGRLMLAINFNMDLGDAWEHADDPGYPEPMTSLAYRFAVNYVIYAMTH
jgi:hypothetical protein